nr:hypothetical protein [Frigidibacter mobilis]
MKGNTPATNRNLLEIGRFAGRWPGPKRLLCPPSHEHLINALAPRLWLDRLVGRKQIFRADFPNCPQLRSRGRYAGFLRTLRPSFRHTLAKLGSDILKQESAMQKGFENGHHGVQLLGFRLPASMRRGAPGINQCAENQFLLFRDVITSFQFV